MNFRALLIILSMLALTPIRSSGAAWERVTAIPYGDVSSLLFDGNTLYAAAGNVIFVSPDGGTTWNPTSPVPLSWAFIDAITVFGGRIIAGTGGEGAFVSSNGGTSWQSLSGGLSGPGSHHIISFASRSNSLYAGTVGSGVFVLSSSTWSPFGDLAANLGGHVNTLAVFGDSLVAGAGGNGYAWFSGPGTTTFDGIPLAPFPGDVFLVTSLLRHGGFLFAGTNFGVFRSSDGGTHWGYAGAGIPNGRPTVLAAHGQTLYAAASGAGTRILRSTNLGESWEVVDNIPFAYTVRITGSRLYAARTDGLWYMDLLPTPVEEEPLPPGILLWQNYPNPFNPSTIITYQHATGNRVTLRIFDILGREVATLVDDEQESGVHTLEWNAQGLPGGVYFCRLTHGPHSITRRMVLLK